MTRWLNLTAEFADSKLAWTQPDGSPHSYSLPEGLNYLGSLGWELVSDLPRTSFGTTMEQILIFRMPAPEPID